jgi:signal transduction histidine kinase
MRNVTDIDPRRRARMLRLGIAAVVFAVVVAMWAAVGISVNESQDAALKSLNSDGANLAFAFDEEVTHTLDAVSGTMDAVSNRMAARRSEINLYAWSRQFPIVTDPVIEAAVIAPNGVLISGTWASKLPTAHMADEDYVRIHRDGKFKGLFIGKQVKSQAHQQMLIPISARVETRDGHFLGVLVFYVSPDKLTTLYKSLNLGDNGIIALDGTDGAVLARFSKASPNGVYDADGSIVGRVGPESVAENSEGSYVQESPIDHVKRLYSYRRGWDYPVVVSVGLDYGEGLALARAHAIMLYALAAGATLLLGGFALYLIREMANRAERDIELASERIKLQVANAELFESKEHAEVANRAKSLFLANMSHELRTPLNAIIGFSQLIKDEVMGPVGKPVYTDYANDIFDAGKHLLEIICNLLDISKIEAGKTELNEELIDPTDLVAASLAAVRVQADRKKIQLAADIPRPVPLVRGDALRLRQILINLLSNSVKFTESGHVRVSIECDLAHGFSFTVTDSGIGMSADEIALALEPFGQIENAITKKYEGTGLGLPLAKRLVELHGGRLIIASTKGAGSTVRVQLPAERIVQPVSEAAA